VKMCLVPRSDKFECQGQRSKVKVTRDKTGKTAASSPLTMHCKASRKPYAANDVIQQQTAPFPCSRRGGGDGVPLVHAGVGLRALYVW